MQKKNLTVEETFTLAFQNHQKNNLEVAENLYKEILKTNSNHVQSNFLLGTLSAQTKKFNIAKQLLKKAIEIQPNYADAHSNLGNVQKELGKHQEAIICFEKAILINPNYAQAHNNLGMTFKELGSLQKAMGCFEKATEIQPNYADAHSNLGIIFIELEKFKKAMGCFEKAIQINPNNAKTHYHLGIVFKELRELKKAMNCFQEAIRLSPDYVYAHYNLMEILEKTHNLQQLEKCIEKAKSSLGNNPIIHIFQTLILLRKNQYHKAKTLLESNDIEQYKNILMAYKIRYYELLSIIYDKLNETKKSFKYFLKINEYDSKKNSNQKYSKEYFFKKIEISKKYFKSKNISKWNKINIPIDRSSPIFLIGFPRSGTTLLDTIFRSHPSIEVVEEEFMVEKMKLFFDDYFNESIDSLNDITDNLIKNIRNTYFERLDLVLTKDKQKNKVIIDKMPLNIMEVGFIHKIFPESKFIFSLRHPCDCVLSCFMHRFKMNNAMVNFINIHDAVSFYNQIMSLWKQYVTELPIQFKTIKYENVVENLEGSITPLLNFLNLEWDKSILSFNQTALKRPIINTPSYNQVIKPLYKQAIGRWKRYDNMIEIYPKLEKWIKEFDY